MSNWLEQPTPQLRILDRGKDQVQVLQQCWLLDVHDAKGHHFRREEWRDVPIVKADRNTVIARESPVTRKRPVSGKKRRRLTKPERRRLTT